MFLSLDSEVMEREVLSVLIDGEMLKTANEEVEDLCLKTLIKSENSAMMYMKVKGFSRLYRPRDFVFLRHVFRDSNRLYMVDKSIDNINYPPFTTIVRGDLLVVWCVSKGSNSVELSADITISNEGYLSDSQNINLILKLLRPFKELESFIKKNKESLAYFNVFS